MEEYHSTFEKYLKRYCEDKKISQEEALKHGIVQEVKKQYDEEKECVYNV